MSIAALPARTPAAIVTKLNTEVVRTLKLPEVHAQLEGLSFEVIGSSPQEFAAFLRNETNRWGTLARSIGANWE